VLNVETVMSGTMRELVMAREELEKVGLEVPPVSKLFSVLGAMGYRVGDLPVSMDQAVEELAKVIDGGGEHTHAHIHEHAKGGMHAHEHRSGRKDESDTE
jgi:hypothetical protein